MPRKPFNRMVTSWFQPDPEAMSERQPRVTARVPDAMKPSVDEFTAAAAMEMLENRAFITIMERLGDAALQEFTTSDFGVAGLATREAAHLKMRVLDDIRTSVQSMADELKLHRRDTRDPDDR